MKFRPSLFTTLLLASGSIARGQEADLSIFKDASKNTPLHGTNVTFSMYVYNDGPDDATGVTVTDLLPDGYEFVSAAPETGTYDEGTGVWTIGNLAYTAGPAYLEITAKVLATGSYQNIASVAGNETDPAPDNNTSSSTPVPTWNLYWDGGDGDIDPLENPPDGFSVGGAGTWDNTLKNWDPGDGETDHLAWDNAVGYTASFGGTTGAVTLGSDISAGKLAITGAYTLSTDINTLTLTGTGTTISGAGAITLSGSGGITLGSSQTWDNTTNTMTVSAPVNTGDNLLTLNTRQNQLDVTGTISGSGGLTVNSTYTNGTTPNNNAPATLNNGNDYTGTTTVNGWIWLNSGGLSALGTDPSDIVLNSGGFRLTGTGAISRGLQITGTCGISKTNGTITTVDGVISGTGNLQVSANFQVVAPVVLANANTFTGNCLAGPDGVVRLAHADALASANLRWADNNGRSVYDLGTHNLAYNIGGLGNAALNNSNNTLNLGTGLGSGGDGLVSFGANNQSNTYVGILSGGAGFRKVGTGTQTLIGDNTYTGNTVVAEGTLKLGKITGQTGVSTTTGTTGSNVNRLTALASVTNLYNGQEVAGPLIPAGARITQINSINQVTITPGPTEPNTPTTVDFADMLGSVAASPVIEVQADATLDVTAYPWTLEADQTLTGTGTVTGAITAAGTVAPGIGGTLTTGDVMFTSTGGYLCTLNGASSGLLAAGSLTVNAGAKVTVSGTPTAASYLIATYTGAEPTHFDESSLPFGYSLDYTEAGKIKLVGTPGEGSPFDAWAAAPPYNLTGADALPGADPDKDGVANIVEFALGGNPTDGSANGASLAKVQDVAGSPALTFTILTRGGTSFDGGSTGPRTATRDGVTYTIQGGQNLSDWTGDIAEVTPAITAGLPTAPAGYEYHTFKSAGPVASTARDFIRVGVEGQ